MIEKTRRTAIYRGLPPKPGPGWGTRCRAMSTIDPQYVVFILYIVWIYTVLHYILGLGRLGTICCTTVYLPTTIYRMLLYLVELCTTQSPYKNRCIYQSYGISRTFRPNPRYSVSPSLPRFSNISYPSRDIPVSTTISCALYLLHTH